MARVCWTQTRVRSGKWGKACYPSPELIYLMSGSARQNQLLKPAAARRHTRKKEGMIAQEFFIFFYTHESQGNNLPRLTVQKSAQTIVQLYCSRHITFILIFFMLFTNHIFVRNFDLSFHICCSSYSLPQFFWLNQTIDASKSRKLRTDLDLEATMTTLQY